MDVVEVKVTALKDQIQSGDYRVDTQAVADAILRRLLSGRGLDVGQNPCSYPDSAPS
jgi:cell division protein YceG involved in septum cleavage